MTEVLRFDRRDGVALLTLDRPARLNAIGSDTHAQLQAALDTIEASVAYSSPTQVFTITVTDVTTGASQTEYPTCPTSCSRTSAEWIAESPSHFGTDSWFPLANYGTVKFTSATATNEQGTSGPISFAPVWSASGIERKAGGTKPEAEVSGLSNGATTSTFSDTWQPRRAR